MKNKGNINMSYSEVKEIINTYGIDAVRVICEERNYHNDGLEFLQAAIRCYSSGYLNEFVCKYDWIYEHIQMCVEDGLDITKEDFNTYNGYWFNVVYDCYA